MSSSRNTSPLAQQEAVPTIPTEEPPPTEELQQQQQPTKKHSSSEPLAKNLFFTTKRARKGGGTSGTFLFWSFHAKVLRSLYTDNNNNEDGHDESDEHRNLEQQTPNPPTPLPNLPVQQDKEDEEEQQQEELDQERPVDWNEVQAFLSDRDALREQKEAAACWHGIAHAAGGRSGIGLVARLLQDRRTAVQEAYAKAAASHVGFGARTRDRLIQLERMAKRLQEQQRQEVQAQGVATTDRMVVTHASGTIDPGARLELDCKIQLWTLLWKDLGAVLPAMDEKKDD